MRVLHLSDLHLRRTDDSLEKTWIAPGAAVRPPYDAVVISGDLTWDAKHEQYKRVAEFVRREILPLLKVQTARRVVMVPGNHDVDWSKTVLRHLPKADLLAENSFKGVADVIADYREHCGNSSYRVRPSPLGDCDMYEIDQAIYSARFDNFQEFLKGLCDDAKADDPPMIFKQFDFSTPGEDFSAHVFPHARVALYGFNSSYRCDAVWKGAAIDHEAIANAKRHADEHAPNCLRVAVFHHGIQSDERRPDYLLLHDMGRFFDAGFRLTFHGHLHRRVVSTLDQVLSQSFPTLGVGSLAVKKEDLPVATGTQFAAADLYPSHVRSETFEASSMAGEFLSLGVRDYPIASVPDLPLPPSCARHRRHYRVDPEGIVKVSVDLDEVRGRRPLVLGVVIPPFCETSHMGAICRGTPRRVNREVLPDGRVRFVLAESLPEGVDIHWEYSVTNAVALTRCDLLHRDFDARFRGTVGPRREFRPHHVRIPCRELEMKWEFSEAVFTDGTVEAVVERPKELAGEIRWEQVGREQQRCELEHDETSATLRVAAPMVNHRYGIAFEPSEEGFEYDQDTSAVLDRLVERLRGELEGRLEGETMRQAMEAALDRLLGVKLSTAWWHALLWNQESKRLRPVFGQIPRNHWGVKFRSGSGVAGHAFRFGLTTSWHNRGEGTELVFQVKPEGQEWGSDYAWIVCVPILGSAEGPPLGVVSFESGHGDRRTEAAFGDFARPREPEEDEGFGERLRIAVQEGFWRPVFLMGKEHGMSTDVRVAQRAIESLELESPLEEENENVLASSDPEASS